MGIHKPILVGLAQYPTSVSVPAFGENTLRLKEVEKCPEMNRPQKESPGKGETEP